MRFCWLPPAWSGWARRIGCASGLIRRSFVPPQGRDRWALRPARTMRATIDAVAFLDHAPTRFAVTAERAALAALGGGCQVPIGIHCREGLRGDAESGPTDEIFAVVAAPETGEAVRVYHSAPRAGSDPVALGRLVAKMLIDAGAGPLLAGSRRSGAMSSLPLSGRRVLVTRAAHQAGKLSEGLRALGAEPVEVPVLEIQPAGQF